LDYGVAPINRHAPRHRYLAGR